jgi:rhodanese-related sulfurtransferase
MKKIITCLLAVLGLTSACGQKNYEEVDVNGFADLIADSSIIIIDTRTAEEYRDGHIEKAINIDVKKDDFLQRAKAALPTDKRIAVYCRSGRRSANACTKLSAEGYKCVNLKGGITAWIEEKRPVE